MFTASIIESGRAVPKIPYVWFTPYDGYGTTGISTNYFTNIEGGNTAFQTMMSNGIGVFKLYEVLATLSPSAQATFFSYLTSKGIKLGVEGFCLVATSGQPGFGVEGFSENATDLFNLLTIIKNAGGEVAYIAWDEPWWFGYYSTGYYSLQNIASQAANAAQTVYSLFPNCLIGDIEPITSDTSETAALQTWLTTYANTAGKQFDFFQQDIAAWESGWQTVSGAVTAMCRSNGVLSGTIVNGYYNDTSNTQWVGHAIATADDLWTTTGLRPDFMIVQSWQQYPSTVMDPTDDNTLAYVANQVISLTS